MAKWIFGFVLLGLGFVFACGGGITSRPGDYKKVMYDGMAKIGCVGELEGLGGATHQLGDQYYYDEGGEMPWVTKVYFENRYVVEMSVQVVVDFNHLKVLRVAGEPVFKISEMTGFNTAQDGASPIVGKVKKFTLKEWGVIYKNNFDFGKIDFEIKKGEAVDGYYEFIEQLKMESENNPLGGLMWS